MTHPIPAFKAGTPFYKLVAGTAIIGAAYEFGCQPFMIGYFKMCGFDWIPKRNLLYGVPAPEGAIKA